MCELRPHVVDKYPLLVVVASSTQVMQLMEQLLETQWNLEPTL